MKAFYFLVALLPLTFAKPRCECPLVNCFGDDAAVSLPFANSPSWVSMTNSTSQRCQCANDAAIACASRCGTKPNTIVSSLGVYQVLQDPLTYPKKCPKPTPTSTHPPAPTQTLCGSRGMAPCADNQYCIADPDNLECSLIADCPGFCVQLNGPMCGGFAGFQCPDKDQVCVDDPRDDCGGPGSADCSGICVRLDGSSSASEVVS